MRRSFLSEWVKLRRRGMLLAAGLVIVLTAMFMALRIATAPTTVSSGETHHALGGQELSIKALSHADGLAQSLGLASSITGAIVLSIVAYSVASEFSRGTLRNLLLREPHRLRLLAGKLIALLTYILAAVLIASLLAIAVGTLAASSTSIDTSSWFTATGIADTASGIGKLMLSSAGWALLGALLALALRSPAYAIAVGLAYAIPIEALLSSAWSSGEHWLPGQLLSALARGGTAEASLGHALLLLAIYALAGLTAAATMFARRDIAV